ncbi:vitellogenin-1-like [Lissotriton helveticus]
MRGITLALVLTLVGSQEGIYAPDFTTSETFVYNYEGLIISGLPEKGCNRAGVKLKCKVEIRTAGPKLCLLQIHSPDVEEYNGVWPKDPFTRSFRLTQVLGAQLAKPIRFEYSSGQVGDIYTAEDVSSLVVNIIRGILNILQLSIKRTQSAYSFQEFGIEGICNTNYIIQEDKKENHIFLTKSKDLNSCQDKVQRITGNEYAQTCTDCDQRNKNDRAFATYNYKIKSTTNGAVILQADVQEAHQFTPFNEMEGAVVVEARQKLVLAEVRKDTPSTPEPELQNRGSLRYHFESELLQAPIQLLNTKNVAHQIIKTLQQLAENMQVSALKDSPAKFLELVQLLRAATYENIDSVWKQFSSRSEYRRWILDAVPAIGNPTALKFLRHYIERAELTEFEAAQAVLVGLHLIKADHDAVAEAAMLLKKINALHTPTLYKVTVLTYGSLLQRHCITTEVCTEAALQPLHDLALEALSSGNEGNMILSLKAIGNAGQLACIKLIQKFLPGFSPGASQLPYSIQVDAVMAMRNIAKKDRRRVQDILMQIFANHKVNAEVRMVASVVLLETKPTAALLMNMANVALTESNLQVASFTYSLLKALSKSQAPDLLTVAAASNIALRILNPKLGRLSFRYSKNLRVDTFTDAIMSGFSTNLFAINKAATTLPTAVIANIKAYLLGVTTDLFEVGLRAEGIQEVIMKRHLDNWSSRAQGGNEIRHILKKLSEWKALPTHAPLASAYLKLFGQEIFFAKLDKDSIKRAVEVFYQTEKKFPKLSDLLRSLQGSLDVHWTKPLLSPEIRYVVPTCIGLPIEKSMYYASVTNAAIDARAQILPSPSSDFSLSQLLDSHIKLHSKMNLSLAKDLIMFIGLNTHLIQAGMELQAKVHAILPVNIAAGVDIKKKNFKIDIDPCRQESEVMSARVKAYSVTRNVEDLAGARMIPVVPSESISNVWKEGFKSGDLLTGDHSKNMGSSPSEFLSKENSYSAEKPLHHPAPAADSRCAKAHQFGFEVCLEKKSANAGFIKNSLLYFLIGEHTAKVSFKPVHTEATIEKIQIEFQAGPHAADKMVHLVDLDEIEDENDEMDAPLHHHALGKLKRILGGQNQTWSENKFQNGTSSSSSSLSKSNSTSCSQSNSECGSDETEDQFKSTFSQVHSPESHRSTTSSYSRSRSSRGSRSSSSMIYSFASGHEPRYLGEAMAPVLTILARAIMSDNKHQGYQVTSYFNPEASEPRIQLVTVQLGQTSPWKFCADAAITKHLKALAMLRWGQECQDYKISAKASTGLLSGNSAAQLQIKWEHVPTWMKRAAHRVMEFAPGVALMLGFSEKEKKSAPHQLILRVAAASPRTIDTIVKTPGVILYFEAVPVPFDVPLDLNLFRKTLHQPSWNYLKQITKQLQNKHSVECEVNEQGFTTFDNRTMKCSLASTGCYCILAQDCTDRLRFLIAMTKTAHPSATHAVNVKLGSSDIKIQPANSEGLQVLFNGMIIMLYNKTYENRREHITISRQESMVIVKASNHGLDQLSFNGETAKVSIASWMRGKTCGICGNADGQRQNDLTKPNHEKALSCSSFIHSWSVPENSCSGGCNFNHQFVKLGPHHDQEEDTTCYSVEPVLQCLKGCVLHKTFPVKVGFHCLPKDNDITIFQRGLYDFPFMFVVWEWSGLTA